jgi:hypothetical protein
LDKRGGVKKIHTKSSHCIPSPSGESAVPAGKSRLEKNVIAFFDWWWGKRGTSDI